MISKKIHYCWFGGNPLPKDVKKYIESWKRYCPDYEIIEWNENNFNINCCKFVKDAYNQKAWAFVSDYARLKIIYENGGIYLDTDVELIRNLDDLLTNHCYFPLQQCDKNVATGLGFGGEKGSSILKEMMEIYHNTLFNISKKNELICPILNTQVLNKYGFEFSNEINLLDNGAITIFPPQYFDPIAPGSSNNLICEKTYSIHHYNATWTSKSSQLKRKIINFIGQNKINKIKRILKRKG